MLMRPGLAGVGRRVQENSQPSQAVENRGPDDCRVLTDAGRERQAVQARLTSPQTSTCRRRAAETPPNAHSPKAAVPYAPAA